MNTTHQFTKRQINDYFKRYIDTIAMVAYAHEHYSIDQILGDPNDLVTGKFVPEVTYENFEDIDSLTSNIVVYVREPIGESNQPGTYTLHGYELYDLDEKQVAQLLADTFIDAGLPEDFKTISKLMAELQANSKREAEAVLNTVVIKLSDGEIDEVYSEKPMVVITSIAPDEELTEEQGYKEDVLDVFHSRNLPLFVSETRTRAHKQREALEALQREPLRRDVVESLFDIEYKNKRLNMNYGERSKRLKRTLKAGPRTVEEALKVIHNELEM